MQSIAATAGHGIGERNRQIVAAEKPGENLRCDRLPFGIVVRVPRGQTGRNCRGGLQRLLIEGVRRLPQFAETGRADGAEMARRCRLLRHQPTQGSQPGVDIDGCLRRQTCDDQGLRQARIIVGEAFLEPLPVRRFDRCQAGHEPFGKDTTDFLGAAIIGNHGAVGVETQQREGRCAGGTKALHGR